MATNPSKDDDNNNNQNPVKLSKKEKGKSCKGTLYYSSALQSKTKNPRCIGIPRSLPQVPNSIVKDEQQQFHDFYYACAGYSVYLDQKSGKESSGDKQTPAKLPVCVGLELLVGRKAPASAPAVTPTAAHALNKEDVHEVRQPQRPKPIQPAGNDFLTRFSRNADLVALGVWKNMGKVGNYLKASVSDILYPYRGRPK
ncbi:hypothetical protein ACLB2K_005706 [Fragaria x ananassa]